MWWTILEWATPGNIIYKSIGASASVSVAGVIDEAVCLTLSGKEVVCRCCDSFHSIAEHEACTNSAACGNPYSQYMFDQFTVMQ